jgi:hypothetical protein
MRIPPPKISFVGGQTRSLSVGLANAVTRSIHDIPVTSTPDTIAKAFGDHSRVLKSLDDLLDELGDAHLALQGSTAGMDTPIVRAIEQYIAERKQAQETYPDLRLPNLEPLIDAMAQASQAADNELVLVKNKSKHRMSALRKAFALGIADATNVGTYLKKFGKGWMSLIPQRWGIPRSLLDADFGEATFDPTSPVGSPERNASVLVTLITNGQKHDEEQAALNKHHREKQTRQQKLSRAEREIKSALAGGI